jgi:hypothetical protein
VLENREGTGRWRKYIMRSFMTNIKDNNMGRVCSTHGKRGMDIGYWWRNQKDRRH